MASENQSQRQMIDAQWRRFAEHWTEYSAAFKERWNQVPDGNIDDTLGHRDALASELQEAYGLNRGDAERQLDAFIEENREYFETVRKTSASTTLSIPLRH